MPVNKCCHTWLKIWDTGILNHHDFMLWPQDCVLLPAYFQSALRPVFHVTLKLVLKTEVLCFFFKQTNKSYNILTLHFYLFQFLIFFFVSLPRLSLWLALRRAQQQVLPLQQLQQPVPRWEVKTSCNCTYQAVVGLGLMLPGNPETYLLTVYNTRQYFFQGLMD